MRHVGPSMAGQNLGAYRLTSMKNEMTDDDGGNVPKKDLYALYAHHSSCQVAWPSTVVLHAVTKKYQLYAGTEHQAVSICGHESLLLNGSIVEIFLGGRLCQTVFTLLPYMLSPEEPSTVLQLIPYVKRIIGNADPSQSLYWRTFILSTWCVFKSSKNDCFYMLT